MDFDSDAEVVEYDDTAAIRKAETTATRVPALRPKASLTSRSEREARDGATTAPSVGADVTDVEKERRAAQSLRDKQAARKALKERLRGQSSPFFLRARAQESRKLQKGGAKGKGKGRGKPR